MKKAAFYTLGCKVNQYETEAMIELFLLRGYEIVDFDLPADVYVINTCTVTGMSDRKSRQIIRRAKKTNPNAIVVVTGCYAQTSHEAVAGIDGVNLVVGTKERQNIAELAEACSLDSVNDTVSDIMHTHTFEDLSIKTYQDRTRAYIKVQEGCSQFCSYCIIPYARGPVRSRPFDDVVSEIRRLAKEGFSEIILTGIHVASYGSDLKNYTLADLILAADSIDGIERIRLSSIEPMTLNREFIDKIKPCKKLCNHFHISLQSGCDATLKRMNRKYTCDEYFSIVQGLRENFPDTAITTDIMVGFPGETDAEFEATVEFVKRVDFADAHIFQYSPRKGTPAAKRPDQIPPETKEKRSKIIAQLTEESRNNFKSRFTGKKMRVLFEQPFHKKDGWFEGKTSNYLTVIVKTDEDISGKFFDVRLEKNTKFGIEGTII